jgi:tetratricopeptide (TPR) repeat protein
MKWHPLIPLLVITAGLFAYENSFQCGFVSDDVASILENPTIRRLWPIWQPLSPPNRGGLTVQGRPLLNLSFAINYAIGGLDVTGYRLVNCLIHLLAGLALFGIVRRTLLQPSLRERFGSRADELAVIAAVLWTVHPLQTESVTYLVQRAESLMGLFYFVTLYCFIRGTQSERRPWWFGMSIIACALGMATKEVMASAPLMALLYDRAFLSGTFREAWRRRGWLYPGLWATWIVLGLVMILGSRSETITIAQKTRLPWLVYVATQPGVILHYLRLSVWPSPLCLDSGWPAPETWGQLLPPMLVLVSLLGLTAWACRSKPALGFLGAWFFLILAPSSSVIPICDPIHEHRMYLSLAAVVVAVTLGAYSLAGRKTVPLFAVAAIGLGCLTWRRNQDYRSELAIRLDSVAKYPHDAVTHYNLAFTLLRLHRPAEAIPHFEQALRIKPDYFELEYNLGITLMEVGRVQEAINHYRRALEINPDYAQAHNNLANALSRTGKLEEAIGHYQHALRSRPDMAEAHNNLGVALVRLGRTEEAVGHFQRAVAARPDYVEAYRNWGGALVQLGRLSEATENYQQAVRLKPDSVEVRNQLGDVLTKLGQTREAVAQYEKALQLRPNSTETQNNLAWLLATLNPADGGNASRAVWLAEKACAGTGHRLPAYLDTLAAGYAAMHRFEDAVATARKAVALSRATGESEQADSIQKRLELYVQGRAYLMK